MRRRSSSVPVRPLFPYPRGDEGGPFQPATHAKIIWPAMMISPSKRVTRGAGLVVVLLAFLWIGFFNWHVVADKLPYGRVKMQEVPDPSKLDKVLVLGKMPNEDVSWTHNLKQWTPFVYTMGKRPERGYILRPPSLQGREAVVYLSFIIDYYDALPNMTAFVHAGREQWHNSELGPWTGTILENLRADTVRRRGYVNLRCEHDPGCPDDVHPKHPTQSDIDGDDIRAHFADVYMELFNVSRADIPEHLGHQCCAQFVVTRDRIRERSREDYVRMRRWAMTQTVTTSFNAGWVFEKTWHVIFGMPPQYCPAPDVCKCELFGWCGVPKGGIKSLPSDHKGIKGKQKL
ncbi:hypothetical protein GGTG_02554 [Gaeumannomyces tritici R3-111a-1]|uniref:Uncharacterized protein n=1 Tax=Gaeumannomyces tritici (strain R3-111a-1) TaxID=644352 RepID=J3NMP8_GAET3|nr:hypothetical protein GGTG_02554 [Gaeumannomyces tritici R3-111a-1]EJT82581.1 hypothetical protein GGTG_02554 [Gaeumannomyces tritici R3-111a-1]